MNSFLCDLFAHQAWADSEHCRIIGSHAASEADENIRERLHHYHLTQRAFLMIAKGEEITFPKRKDVPPASELKISMRRFHEEAAAFLGSVSEAQIAERVRIPWFRNPQIEITIGEALLQAAMHSQYHRGQNAARLRELGIDPPMTDLIAWWWKGRPAPQWE